MVQYWPELKQDMYGVSVYETKRKWRMTIQESDKEEKHWIEPIWIPNYFPKPLHQIEFQINQMGFQINQIEISMTVNSHNLTLHSQSQIM